MRAPGNLSPVIWCLVGVHENELLRKPNSWKGYQACCSRRDSPCPVCMFSYRRGQCNKWRRQRRKCACSFHLGHTGQEQCPEASASLSLPPPPPPSAVKCVKSKLWHLSSSMEKSSLCWKVEPENAMSGKKVAFCIDWVDRKGSPYTTTQIFFSRKLILGQEMSFDTESFAHLHSITYISWYLEANIIFWSLGSWAGMLKLNFSRELDGRCDMMNKVPVCCFRGKVKSQVNRIKWTKFWAY